MAWKYRKIRKVVTKNITGDSYGINVPVVIAEQFESVSFTICVSGNSIILTSGVGYIGK